jgi:GNAT superfamily N-acetyltransferase
MNITFSIKSLPNAFADAKSQVCGAILHSLPDWFGIPEAIDDYAKSVKDKPFWAAYNGEQAVGFIALTEHNPYTAEIHVMGIDHSCLRRGIGKRWIEAAEQYCHERGKTMLLVKTIDFSHPDIF